MAFSDPLVKQMSGDLWFSSLPPVEQQILVTKSTRIRIDNGELLFRRGDSPNGFYGVVEGRLHVSNVRSDGQEGSLAILEPGNWFGAMSMITGWPCAYDVTALEAAQVLRLSPDVFNSCMQSAVFAKAIAGLVSQHACLLYELL